MKTKPKIYFDNIEQVILEHLSQAKVSVRVASAWFTNKNLMKKLKEKAQNGLNIELLISNVSLNDYQPSDRFFEELIQTGGEVFRHGAEHFSEGKIMHNKICLIDDVTVITGSYNWTQQANRNEENVMIISDVEVAREFNDRFRFLRSTAQLFGEHDEDRLLLSLTADNYLVDPGQEFQIHWQSRNADTVEIDNGIGKVESENTKHLTIHENTHIKAIARKGSEITTKSIFIKIIQSPILRYHLTYLEPSTGRHLQLKPNGNFLDSYSVLEGQQLQLHWKTEHAVKVRISGHNECPANGSLPITVDTLKTFRIEALSIKHLVSESFSLRPIKLPRLDRVISPLPNDIHVTTQFNFEPKLVPSTFQISGEPLKVHCPTIEDLRTKISSKEPNLRQLAEKYQINKQTLKKELKRNTHAGVISHLKDHFSQNRKILQYLSSLIKRHA